MKNRIIALVVAVFLLLAFASCRKATAPFIQEPTIVWEKIYYYTDSGIGYSVQEVFDGGYIITGYSFSFDTWEKDAYLVRTDNNGDTIWTRTYGGAEDDEGRSVCQTADGGFVVVGSTVSYGNGNSDVYLIKTNSNGDTIWTKPVGGSDADAAYSVCNTQDGNFIVAGKTRSFGAIGTDIYLLKAGQDGSILWEKRIGGSSSESAYSIQQTDDQGFIMVGSISSGLLGSYLIYLLKTNENGDTTWTRTFGGTTGDASWGFSVCQTLDGGYIISGYDRPNGAAQSTIYLLKTNAAGDSIWAKSYGELGPGTAGYSVRQTPDGGYIVVGFNYNTSDTDAYAIRTNAIGDTIWTLCYGGSQDDGDEKAYSVCLTSDGGYVMTGYTCTQGAVMGEEVYLIKIR